MSRNRLDRQNTELGASTLVYVSTLFTLALQPNGQNAWCQMVTRGFFASFLFMIMHRFLHVRMLFLPVFPALFTFACIQFVYSKLPIEPFHPHFVSLLRLAYLIDIWSFRTALIDRFFPTTLYNAPILPFVTKNHPQTPPPRQRRRIRRRLRIKEILQ